MFRQYVHIYVSIRHAGILLKTAQKIRYVRAMNKTRQRGSSLQMPPIVSLLTRKGGVGKTSVSALVGSAWADSGARVLVVDLDAQGNTAPTLGIDNTDKGLNLADAIALGHPLRPMPTSLPGLDIVAGGPRLDNLSRHLALQTDEALRAIEEFHAGERSVFPGLPRQEVGLREALSALCSERHYDVVLMDCPPGSPVMQEVVLYTSHGLVIPITPDPKARLAYNETVLYFEDFRDPSTARLQSAVALVAHDVFLSAQRASAAETEIRKFLRANPKEKRLPVFNTTWALHDAVATALAEAVNSNKNPYAFLVRLSEARRRARRKDFPGKYRAKEARHALDMIHALADEMWQFSRTLDPDLEAEPSPGGMSGETQSEESGDASADLAEEPTEVLAEEPTGVPAEEPTGVPAEKPTEKSTEEDAEMGDEVAGQSAVVEKSVGDQVEKSVGDQKVQDDDFDFDKAAQDDTPEWEEAADLVDKLSKDVGAASGNSDGAAIDLRDPTPSEDQPERGI
jgi:cellulose biosynthesis protein BcsQ